MIFNNPKPQFMRERANDQLSLNLKFLQSTKEIFMLKSHATDWRKYLSKKSNKGLLSKTQNY